MGGWRGTGDVRTAGRMVAPGKKRGCAEKTETKAFWVKAVGSSPRTMESTRNEIQPDTISKGRPHLLGELMGRQADGGAAHEHRRADEPDGILKRLGVRRSGVGRLWQGGRNCEIPPTPPRTYLTSVTAQMGLDK